jgi:hypothetical protein
LLSSPVKPPGSIPPTPQKDKDAFHISEALKDWKDPCTQGRPPHSKSQRNISLLNEEKKRTERPTTLRSPKKREQTLRGARKAFDQRKAELANNFLRDLDNTITHGQIGKLAVGGVQVVWSKKLNTTAGRASWSRKSEVANIELSEKVVDDERSWYH